MQTHPAVNVKVCRRRLQPQRDFAYIGGIYWKSLTAICQEE